MKNVNKITLKSYNRGGDITTVWGCYFDNDNGIHDMPHGKAVFDDFLDIVEYMDGVIEKMFGVLDYDTCNSTEGNEFTRTYYINEL